MVLSEWGSSKMYNNGKIMTDSEKLTVAKVANASKFYQYRQNNSGDSILKSEKDGICEYVIIEALNADDANNRAEEIGLYFDGCDSGKDCRHCGDRWYRADEDDGDDAPAIYGEPLENMGDDSYVENCFIHYLDGTIMKVEFNVGHEQQTSLHNTTNTFLPAVSIQHKVEKLIPFISEEFITYPLREEGRYIPFLKCWQKADTANKCTRLSNKLNKHFEKTGYEISFIGKEHRSVIHEFYIYPKWKELKNGSYKFVKKDWSIEEMLDLLLDVLK